MKKSKKGDNKVLENNEQSFFDKMKKDKKYSAKVQLLGYAVLIVALVIYLNFANTSNSRTIGNSLTGGIEDEKISESASDDSVSLLSILDNNYRFDIVVEMDKKNDKEIEDVTIKYFGKSYLNQLELTKESIDGKMVYYKVDDLYYLKNADKVQVISDEDLYDFDGGDYFEISGILKLLKKASLDHVTDYSSGKKEYVYHMKVKDMINSYQLDDVVEFKVVEENEVIKIEVDYSILFALIDNNIESCTLVATVSEIGKIEKFSVLKVDNQDEE